MRALWLQFLFSDRPQEAAASSTVSAGSGAAQLLVAREALKANTAASGHHLIYSPEIVLHILLCVLHMPECVHTLTHITHTQHKHIDSVSLHMGREKMYVQMGSY